MRCRGVIIGNNSAPYATLILPIGLGKHLRILCMEQIDPPLECGCPLMGNNSSKQPGRNMKMNNAISKAALGGGFT
jgi:hypothetical protein